MRFDEKARENLEAAGLLLPDASGDRDGLMNASVSRAYYAAYLCIADVAQRRGLAFTSTENDYYRHDTFPVKALMAGIIDGSGRVDVEWLRGLRVKADYLEDQVSLSEASEAFEVAGTLVDALLGEEGR